MILMFMLSQPLRITYARQGHQCRVVFKFIRLMTPVFTHSRMHLVNPKLFKFLSLREVKAPQTMYTAGVSRVKCRGASLKLPLSLPYLSRDLSLADPSHLPSFPKRKLQVEVEVGERSKVSGICSEDTKRGTEEEEARVCLSESEAAKVKSSSC